MPHLSVREESPGADVRPTPLLLCQASKQLPYPMSMAAMAAIGVANYYLLKWSDARDKKAALRSSSARKE